MNRLKQWTTKFMEKRNGFDSLNLFLFLLYGIFLYVSGHVKEWWPLLLCFLFMAVVLFRTFSKNLTKRQLENARFRGIFHPLGKLIDRLFTPRPKKYRVLECKNCHTKVKVPYQSKYRPVCPKCHRQL